MAKPSCCSMGNVAKSKNERTTETGLTYAAEAHMNRIARGDPFECDNVKEKYSEQYQATRLITGNLLVCRPSPTWRATLRSQSSLACRKSC